VDTSISMLERAQSTALTKWDVTRSALLSGLEQLSLPLNVGLVLFPQVPSNTMPCIEKALSVSFAPLEDQQRERCGDILASTEPDGNTPTYDAYAYAVEQLNLLDSAGPEVILLVTDGLPASNSAALARAFHPSRRGMIS
jgi:hypothetical protein